MKWEEESTGRWVSGDYRIWLDSWDASQRKYHVTFRGAGWNAWEYDTLVQAQAFASKHARCWMELYWIRLAAGSYQSLCGHYRVERHGRHWELSYDGSYLVSYERLSGAQSHAQDDSLDRSLAAAEDTGVIEDAPHGKGVTVADVLLEAVGSIANGTEADVSPPARTVLLAAAEAVQRTWTPTYGGLDSIDSVCVLQARLGVEAAA